MSFSLATRAGRTRVIVVAGLFVAMLVTTFVMVGIAVNANSVQAKPKEDEESKVAKLMKFAHKGKPDLRDAPLEIVQDEVKKETPDWEVLAKNTLPLAELAAAIKDNESYTSRPGPYVDAVKKLTKATKDENVNDARTAVAGLMQSCAGCHRYGS